MSAYGAVLEVVLHQSGDKVIHERINARVVGGGSKNQLGVAESITDGQGHIISCEVIDKNSRASFGSELFCKEIYSISGVTVNRSVGDHDSVCFRCVGRPGVIKSDIMAKVFVYGLVHEADRSSGYQGLPATLRSACTCFPYFPTIPMK